MAHYDLSVGDRRARTTYNAWQRAANTAFLFFMNPILDPETNRISGTKLMAWIVVFFDSFDIVHNHSLQELRITTATKTVIDAIDIHNVALYALAFGIWFGKAGMAWMVDLVNAWKGRRDDPATG
jgi:hypothetical protein